MDLNGKRALVTGSSRGLGRAIAIALAKNGADVLVNYLKSNDKAEQVVAEIKSMGRESKAYQADIASEDSVQDLAQRILRDFDHLDILVNNAGTIIRPGAWDALHGNELNRTIDLNLKGTIYCIQAFAPLMIKVKFGRIINITSTYGITGAAPVLAYTAAKAAIISITYAMARELGQYGITVNAIAPGNFDTDLATEAGDAINNWAISTTPLGRLGKPEEIGEAAVYLVEADFITGHVLTVDGGQILNM